MNFGRGKTAVVSHSNYFCASVKRDEKVLFWLGLESSFFRSILGWRGSMAFPQRRVLASILEINRYTIEYNLTTKETLLLFFCQDCRRTFFWVESFLYLVWMFMRFKIFKCLLCCIFWGEFLLLKWFLMYYNRKSLKMLILGNLLKYCLKKFLRCPKKPMHFNRKYQLNQPKKLKFCLETIQKSSIK